MNLRPSKLYKGVTSPLANPGEIDFVVVREGTEGLYCGAGGAVRRDTPAEVATEVSITPPTAWSAWCATPSTWP